MYFCRKIKVSFVSLNSQLNTAKCITRKEINCCRQKLLTSPFFFLEYRIFDAIANGANYGIIQENNFGINDYCFGRVLNKRGISNLKLKIIKIQIFAHQTAECSKIG